MKSTPSSWNKENLQSRYESYKIVLESNSSSIPKTPSTSHQHFFDIVYSTCLSNKAITDDMSRILILDSSFNPPTLAHFHLILKSYSKLISIHGKDRIDAIVLLFTTRNADKSLSSGASVLQRLMMMCQMAQEIHNALNITTSVTNVIIPIFVAMTDATTFIQKGVILYRIHPSLKESYFIMGEDTLIRFLDPKYYPDETVTDMLLRFVKMRNRILFADRPPQAAIQSSNATSITKERLYLLEKELFDRFLEEAAIDWNQAFIPVEGWGHSLTSIGSQTKSHHSVSNDPQAWYSVSSTQTRDTLRRYYTTQDEQQKSNILSVLQQTLVLPSILSIILEERIYQ